MQIYDRTVDGMHQRSVAVRTVPAVAMLRKKGAKILVTEKGRERELLGGHVRGDVDVAWLG